MTDFNSITLPDALRNSLQAMKFENPTPIQAQAIPVALEGRDILGSAQTGTGKTAAFGIPLIAKLLNNPVGSAIVLTPTRELASQVIKVIHQLLGNKSNINTALLIGGDSMHKQFQQLRARPRIIVGTPGRVNDHLNRKSLNLGECCMLVLDETDRMMDMGFGVQIDKVISYIPKNRQTLLFSATLSPQIVKVAARYLNDAVRISVDSDNTAVTKIKQESIRINHGDKYPELVKQLGTRTGSVIIFVKTKNSADKLASKLNKENLGADAIHGDLRQQRREKVIANFRGKKFRILVATDVASRGLDIPHIEHVINYDVPMQPEDYIHRIGRTARAGAEGAALSFISPEENGKWREIERLLDPNKKFDPAQRSHNGGGNGGGRSRNYAGNKGNGGGGRNNSGSNSNGNGGANGGGNGERNNNKKKFRFKRFNQHGEGKQAA